MKTVLFILLLAALLQTPQLQAQELRSDDHSQSDRTMPLSATAVSRPRILIYGADKLSDCSAQTSALQAELATLPYPGDWRILLVCSPVAWNNLLTATGVHDTSTAFTNLVHRTTVVNAAIFYKFHSAYRRTLAHELGHIVCNCTSEAKADEFAFKSSIARQDTHN